MQNSQSVRDAIDKYKDAGCPIGGAPMNAGHPEAWKETASDIASGQIDPTQAEVGAYTGSINSNSDGSASMTINNTTGLASLSGVSTYAPSITGAVDFAGSVMGMSPVQQTFQWTEPGPCSQ